MTTLHSPNDHLRVTSQGIYEIIEVTDSQCPGIVLADASTYKVDWILGPQPGFLP